MYGYRGKILRVDLTDGSISHLDIDTELAKKFLGGAGYATRLLYDMVGPETDPLSPENPLIMMNGPFCGTMVPTGSKTSLCSKSPYTGILGYSTFGGHLGADLRFAGYDGLIVEGASKTPVYILVEDDKLTIKDAEHIWGKDTQETWDIVRTETGHRNAGVARIGIAGENLVKFASVIVDHQRAAGRTGLGAVMGSKKLKAIVAKGSDRKIPVANPEGLQSLCRALNEDKKDDPTFKMYSDLGTAGFVDMATLMYGSLPSGYYTVSEFDAYEISGTTLRERYLTGKKACFRCPIGCGRDIEIKEGKYATGKFAGPELEVTGTMGTLILNNNLEALAFASQKLDLLGMDTISAGTTVAFAYYLFQEGKIQSEDLDGIEPEWGDIDAALELLDKMANREGIGDVLAEGSAFFGKHFGVENLAAQVNGLEMPMHDPRAFSGMAIGYMTSPRGACHMSADMYNVQMGQTNEAFGIESEDRFANEAEIAAKLQNFRCITNSALICNFYPIFADEFLELLNLTTGWDYSLEYLEKTGERIFTLMRLFNIKMGYNPENERLPDIVLKPMEGATEGHVPDTEAQLETWYNFRGWDRKTGTPTEKHLQELGLESL